jgi:hypothetical protein
MENSKMQTNIKIISTALAILFSHGVAQAQENISMSFDGQNGSIQGVLTNKKTVRLLKIEGEVSQNFSLVGDLFQGQSNRQWKESCKRFSYNPRVINGGKESLYIQSSELPFSNEKIAARLGFPLETPISVLSITPEILLNEKAFVLKVYKSMTPREVVSSLESQIKTELMKVKRGQSLKLNMTGEGAFSCDLVQGYAQLKIKMEVRHQYAWPNVFSPLSNREIELLSKNLAVQYAWTGTPLENSIKAGAMAMLELQKLGVANINLQDDQPGRMYWNGSTLTQLVSPLLDAQSGKAKILNSLEAVQLAEKLKVTSFPNRETELGITADFGGVQ